MSASCPKAWRPPNSPRGSATQRIGRSGRFRRGSLTLAVVPFVAQDDYDRLLWACDLNFVRGEDSFVRAQWAARPLVWHCYPQAENAHLAKLDAFLVAVCGGLGARTSRPRMPGFATGLERSRGARSRLDGVRTAPLPALTAHAQTWAASLAVMPDLASGLVEFAEKRV